MGLSVSGSTRSAWFIQEEPVGVKAMWKRGCLPNHVLISGVWWVA